jgi:hypothetical protein
MPLTALKLCTLPAGLHRAGPNLYAQIKEPGQGSWLLPLHARRACHEHGPGPDPRRQPADARAKAAEARALLHQGIDPRTHRNAAREAAKAASDRAISFGAVFEHYLAAQEHGWRNAKHRADVRASMALHVLPTLGALPVGAIDTSLVLKVLEPLWTVIPETASRLRGRIESVLSYATARGWREGPNPAVWRGHLQLMLPRRSKVKPVVHHPALDWREATAFMTALRAHDSIGARAL